MEFPQYRKYNNDKNFFKIESDSNYIELQLIGSKYASHVFEAKILPDRNHVYDLLNPQTEHIVIITEEEFESHYSRFKTQ